MEKREPLAHLCEKRALFCGYERKDTEYNILQGSKKESPEMRTKGTESDNDS